jgi:hypothetical protein
MRLRMSTVAIAAIFLGLTVVGCGQISNESRPDVPVCTSACGLHQMCAFVNEVSAATTCACVPGYSDSAGACTWQGEGVNKGGLRDGKLNNPAAWETTLIAFNPTEFSSDNGSVSFKTAFGLCGESALRQTFDMPEYKDAEPLVLEVEYLSQATGQQSDGGAVVRFNGSDEIIPFRARNGTARMCLGQNAYGAGVRFELLPLISPYACNAGQDPPTSRLFRSFQIKPAVPGECAVPGVIANPTFNTNTDGWKFSTANTRVANPNAVLRVAATAGYGSISASTPLSIPKRDVLPDAALRFKYNTALGNADYMNATRYLRRIDVQLNDQDLGILYPTDGAPAAVATICLPDWAQGMAYDLQFIGGSPTNTGFPAGATDYYYMYLDDVELVSDAACSFDGSFERSANQSSWMFDKGTFPRVPIPLGFVNDARLAHSGNSVMDFEPPRDLGYFEGRVVRWLKVPPISGAAKPVLKFWHRAVSLPPFTVNTSPATGAAAPTATWEQQSLCLNPRMAGHLQQFTWSISANADAGIHHYYLDDVELTTSTSCP